MAHNSHRYDPTNCIQAIWSTLAMQHLIAPFPSYTVSVLTYCRSTTSSLRSCLSLFPWKWKEQMCFLNLQILLFLPVWIFLQHFHLKLAFRPQFPPLCHSEDVFKWIYNGFTSLHQWLAEWWNGNCWARTGLSKRDDQHPCWKEMD